MLYISTDATATSCEEDEVTYLDGEMFMRDLCTTCQCNNGTINCTTKFEVCPDCKNGTSPVNVSNQCCPKCLPGKIRSHDMLIINDITECKLMEEKAEVLKLFDTCHSVTPVMLHKCPEQCVDNDIKCCTTNYVTKSAKFECDNIPGLELDLKYFDAKDCNCEPCG